MSRYFDESTNYTIDYDQRPRPYHVVIADIVSRGPHSRPSVLDVGAGVGNTLVEIDRRGTSIEAEAADIDPECLRQILLRRPGTKTTLLDGPENIYDLGGPYDVVLLSHVLQYDHEPVRLLRHLLGMLRSDGYMIVAIPNLVTPARLVAYSRNAAGTQGVFYWDRDSFARFLTEVVGAELIEIRGDYVPLPGEGRLPMLTRLGVRLMRRRPLLSFSTIAVVSPR